MNSANSNSNSPAPTLTDVTAVGRKVVTYSIIFLISYMVLKALIGAFITYWQNTHPEPPPPPTVGFGQLPAVVFPQQTAADQPQSYDLEMATTSFPDFGDRAKVYLMPQAAPSLLADEEVRQIAANYNFIFDPELLNSETYRWTKTEPLNTTIEINLRTRNFSLTSDYLAHPELLTNDQMPDDYEAVNRVKSFLSKNDLLAKDVATNSGQVTFLKALGGDLFPADSSSDADFMQIKLDRMAIDGYMEMFNEQGRGGVIKAVLTPALNGQDSIVAIESNYHEIDYTQIETYPLRTAKEAWQEVLAGEAYVVNWTGGKEATVRKVEIGYYDSTVEQDYLQPIYIFTGDNDFMAYVSAIESKYLAQE